MSVSILPNYAQYATQSANSIHILQFFFTISTLKVNTDEKENDTHIRTSQFH